MVMRHGPDQCLALPQRQVARLPARGGPHRAAGLQSMEEFMAQEGMVVANQGIPRIGCHCLDGGELFQDELGHATPAFSVKTDTAG
ncbi:hypothetical protein LOKO_03477 [Halomonas chromatireducens]|uniref:Uncharacterized protein n=1 Tax=Halomonas chromatireducens TaxID=507626 RepID=A0A109UNA4_9GAMM|nr:hypothetical protein LOKO_03477 [Halomonas chromatireducens]